MEHSSRSSEDASQGSRQTATDGGDDRVYYVISDLHIGGDEQLEEVEFIDELLSFLERLETTDENAELVINGDAFGLWEFTTIEGMAKFDHLEKTYPDLFEQLRATGETIQITMLPGNHDHELAAYDEYVDRLAEYNVDLVQDPSIRREVGEQAIHFEHGHQQDPNNRIEDWGNQHATPLGYFYNTLVTSRAGQLSDRGRYNWLKDVQAVTPTERMPVWLLSKYFYREMNPVLRYALVPFLLLFNLSVLLAAVAGLDLLGIWSTPVEEGTAFLGQFGTAGTAAWFLLAINVVVTTVFVLIAVPAYFIVRDIRKTVDRFGIFETSLTVDTGAPYEEAATEIFESDPETTIFCYGHTHRPKIEAIDGGILVNSGTWLKRLHRRDGISGFLPPVFYPSYQLATVRIAPEDEGVAVEYELIEKPSPKTEELTRTERLFTVGREPDPTLPDGTIVPNKLADDPAETPAATVLPDD